MKAWLMRAGIVRRFWFGADQGLHVEQAFVHPNLQYPGNGVLGLALDIAPVAANPELPNAHVARGAGDDLVGYPVAGAAPEILVPVVGWADETALHPYRVPATAPWAARILAARRATWLGLTVFQLAVGGVIEIPAIPHDVDTPGARMGRGHTIRTPVRTSTVHLQWYIRSPLSNPGFSPKSDRQ